MTTRERMTWGGKSAAGPVLPVEQAAKKAAESKGASAHPQTPDEGITHPAGYPDPTQPADYENGDTSSWAEDPQGPPYRTSPAPAVPVDDGGYKHPATQPGAPAKNAADKEATRDLRAAVERKASLCIRIAASLLGEKISKAADEGDKIAVDMIEAQALDFMDLSDERIASTLRRVEAATEDEEVLLRKMLAAEEGEEPEAEPEETKEASAKVADDAVTAKLAEVTSMLANLQAELASMKGGHKAEEAPVEAEEAMLAEMLKEEASKASSPAHGGDDEAEAMLQAMLAEETVAPVEAPAEASVDADPSLAQYLEDDGLGVSMDAMDDPMGLLDAPVLGEEDDAVLATLFASEQPVAKTADEEEEEEVEEEVEFEGSKQAATRTASVDPKLRPQPKKPSAGARTVGTQTRTAAAVGDVSDLAKLWDSAPDVSKVFNS